MSVLNQIVFPTEKKESLRVKYGETLTNLGEKNENIIVLDADLSTSTQTALFKKKFPERHLDMGIAEADMISTAAGISTTELIPFASSFAMFAVGRAFEQIRNSIAYADLPVKIVATHAGITVGEDGGSHQMIEDIALMRVLPNMSVIVPADAYETEQVINAIVDYKHPVYVRLSRDKFPALYNSNYKYKFGKWDVVYSSGTELVIFACGLMVSQCLEAAHNLKKNNINCTVINSSTIKPMDNNIIDKYAKNAKLVVTAEEALTAGGLGGMIAEYLSETTPRYILKIGINDKFGQSGSISDLIKAYELDPESVEKKILNKWKEIK